MTTPTREQVVQWADESVFDIVKADCYHEFDEVADSGNLWITRRLTDFAALARADLEATVKEQSQQLSDLTAHAESIEKLSRERGRQLEEQAAEIERLKAEQNKLAREEAKKMVENGTGSYWKSQGKQLAAAQLHIEQLLEVIQTAADQIRKCDYTPARSTLLVSLSTQPDLSALEDEHQRVAEACAKVCDRGGTIGAGMCSEALRAGQWREHL